MRPQPSVFVVVVRTVFAASLDRDFRVSFFALVRDVAPDRASGFDAVIRLRFFLHPAFRGAVLTITISAASLDRDFRVSFFALVRNVAPDRASGFDSMIALRPLVHPAFRGMGLFSISHDMTPAVFSLRFADHPLLLDDSLIR